ncbi:MAG TPA: MarR family winged helix-turn-helix transcriptional regulator [Candidatus Sulfotelmatobacter sp.]|nr:MarR family winged helix-turn-helix transcriptional regulator [Candidatus Sulfotelmatobacter sp.]
MKKLAPPPLPCMCATLRRCARAMTQHYEDALRPWGLRGTQFTILQALELAGEVSQGELGKILAMDSTTLTRTLEIMARQGWVKKWSGRDRRERRLRLAKAGQLQLKRALPAWQRVQSRLRQRLGEEFWGRLMTLTNEVTSVVTEEE